MQVPAKSGSLFFNYKKSFRIVLLALCDASYELAAVDFGEVGRQSDDGVFANSNLGRSIVNDYFDLPHPKKLYSESKFFQGWCFRTETKSFEALLFFEFETCINYRRSRARQILENTFGILLLDLQYFASLYYLAWRWLRTNACIALHNYLMVNKNFGETNSYCLMDLLTKMFEVKENGGDL